MNFRRLFPSVWINPSDVGRHHESNTNKRDQICGDIDANGFDWQIWAVAGSGFFTDSYNLFATNVILPSLVFVYWRDDLTSGHETAINAVTLAGSLLGMLLFGYLADRYGRRKLYGVELIVVIFGTLGLVQCSAGYNNQSMDILGWLVFWRFFVGLGIGAEYPLSAVITAEFAPRRARARMMAAVFIMQPLGQLLASVVGLAVLVTVGRNLNSETSLEAQAVTIDRIWRYVIGMGAIPALVAIGFRLTIPESPRYTLDVDHDGARALRDTQKYYNIHRQSTNGSFGALGNRHNGDVEDDAGMQRLPTAAIDPATTRDTDADDNDDDSMEIQDLSDGDSDDQDEPRERQIMSDPFSRSELVQYFWKEGNIKYLAGTCGSWFLFDFAFYGLGINNPRVLAQIWSSEPVPVNQPKSPDWATDPNQSIYDTLKSGAIRSIITISIGSILGSLIIIKAINYIPRKAWLAWSFVGMAVLFAVIGGSYFRVAYSNLHALTITLYVLCQLLFNLGPNTLTFIIPAEIFPTRYRATCHGISAAAGKLASVIVQAFLPQTKITNANSKNLGWVLIAFSLAMALGAVCTWAWIPELQNARGTDMESRGRHSRFRDYEVPSKSLEELAVGRIGVVDEKNMVGLRKRTKLLLGQMRETRNTRTI